MPGLDFTPFPLVPWWERPDVVTPDRLHKALAAGPDGSGGVESGMLSVEQILSLLTPEDLEGLADPAMLRLSKSDHYTATVDDDGKIIAFTVGSKILTLPSAAAALAQAEGFRIIASAQGGALMIQRSGTDTILGATSISLAQGEIATIFLDAAGTGWRAAVVPAYNNVAKLDAVNTFTKRQNLAKGTDVASASSIALPDNGNFFDVTGTATITGISTATPAGTRVQLRAVAAWTLQHNATSLILPNAANLTATVGNIIELMSLGSGNYQLVHANIGSTVAPYASPEQVITSGGPLVLSHGLGSKPIFFQFDLVCKTAENGYSVNDPVPLVGVDFGDASRGVVVTGADATTLSIRYGSTATVFAIPHKTTGVGSAITNANWRLIVRAKIS